jgi:UDP-3-O-[3-hydroxymyristoyl] glucosamine N-acyltransferase
MTQRTFTTRQIAKIVGGRLEGDGDVTLHGVARLDTAGPEDLAFAMDRRRVKQIDACQAGALLVPEWAQLDDARPLIRVEAVQPALARLLGELADDPPLPPPGVDPSAHIADDITIPDDARIGPGVVIASGVKLGRRCALLANACIADGVTLGDDVVLCEGVVIRHGCVLGDRVRIGPNSVIGYEGFGYYCADGAHHHVPHAGNVVIEDDVHLGACTCVDRAKFGSTRIGAGTKIDNLVQIAHNCRIGRRCLIAGMAGAAGSAQLGDGAMLGGHAGVLDNTAIGPGAILGGYSSNTSDIPAGECHVGAPARPMRQRFREIVAVERLPDLLKKIKDLEKRLGELESATDHPD